MANIMFLWWRASAVYIAVYIVQARQDLQSVNDDIGTIIILITVLFITIADRVHVDCIRS